MADNVVVTAGSGTTVGADEVVDGTLGTVKVGYVKLMDGTIDGTTKAAVGANGLAVDVKAVAAGTNIIGKVTTDQTTHGTTDLVAADLTKVAGSSIATGHGTAAGSVRVELPTDGTGLVSAAQSGTWTVQPGNTANTTAWKVDGSAVTQPVSGTVSITSNSAVNVAQINAVTPLMGNGVTGTGSQRVTVASDNTPFATKTDQTTHGTTDLVAADITKVAGSAISQGHGTAAAAIRVELPTDGTGVVGLAAGSAVIGHVIADSGSTTAVTQATASNLKAQVAQLASISTSATLQSAVGATGNGSTISTDGMSTVVFTITGSFTATVSFEGTEDGTNYTALSAVNIGTTTIATSTTTTGVWEAPCAGLQLVRARVTWTSGTSVTVTAHAVPVSYNPKTINANIVANTATNQSTNVAQINGVTTLMGNGTTGTGSQRVTIASDNTAFSVNSTLQTQTDTVMVGGVNVKEINAVTPLMGNGVTGTGSQRVTIASDNTVLPGVGAGATGAAVPANAVYNGGIATTANPTSATAGNTVGFMADKAGRVVVTQGHVRELVGTQTTTLSASTAETTILTAGAAGVFNDIALVTVANTSASTQTRIDFRDATAGSVIFSLDSPGNSTVGFAPPIPIPQTTAAGNWTAQCASSTTDVRIFVQYLKNK